MNAVSRPTACSGGTPAHCDASPSPVSPMTRKEIGLSAERSTTRFVGEPSSSIHLTRIALTGSPNSRATRSLRDCHSGTGFSHENGLRRPAP
jgi:hypothetical protein